MGQLAWFLVVVLVALVTMAASSSRVTMREVKASDVPPRVLVVTAHPDDETSFAASLYKLAHDLRGDVDIMIISNGEGGFSCSTYAEWVYKRTIE